MNDAFDELTSIEVDIHRAAQALLQQQRDDGHWVFELDDPGRVHPFAPVSR